MASEALTTLTYSQQTAWAALLELLRESEGECDRCNNCNYPLVRATFTTSEWIVSHTHCLNCGLHTEKGERHGQWRRRGMVGEGRRGWGKRAALSPRLTLRQEKKSARIYRETHPYHCSECRGLWREDELMAGGRCPCCGQPTSRQEGERHG